MPREYQRVEYLQSNGLQYINTGVPLTDNYSVDINYNLSYIQEAAFICGVRKDSSSRLCWFLCGNNTGISRGYQSGYGNEFYNGFGNGQIANVWSRLRVARYSGLYIYSLYVNNELVADIPYTTRNINSASYPLYILWGNSAGTGVLDKTSAKLGKCKIANGIQSVCELVPCYRKSDNKPGMYDIVSNTFITNAGTGEFTIGPNVR